VNRAARLDAAEVRFQRLCRALVNATRDEVASAGHTREHLSCVVELLATAARVQWRRVLALSASAE
jgi:hypothetical protein